MDNKYNTRVRQAISDEYIKTLDAKKHLSKELEKVINILYNEKSKENMSYAEYECKMRQRDALKSAINVADIQINVWDKAREICLDVADEMGKLRSNS